MIAYHDDSAEIDGYLFRKDKKTGYYLSGKAINGKRKRLHVYMWERENGEIPAGYEIHHKDHNKNNNEIDNLEMLTEKEHQRRHIDEKTKEQKENAARIVKEKALPCAIKWHKSEKGREWHLQHYDQMKDKLHRKAEYICEYCGKHYITQVGKQNRFCSNNCKSAYRRKAGFDNIERECAYCGKLFVTNKYSTAKYCQEHRRQIRYSNRNGGRLQHGSER